MKKGIDQAFIERSAKLAALKKHPAWPEYIAALDGVAEATEKLLLTHMVHGEHPSLEKVYYTRGAVYMLRSFKAVVERAEDTIERSLREANDKEK